MHNEGLFNDNHSQEISINKQFFVIEIFGPHLHPETFDVLSLTNRVADNKRNAFYLLPNNCTKSCSKAHLGETNRFVNDNDE
jgi:hypothetical protein